MQAPFFFIEFAFKLFLVYLSIITKHYFLLMIMNAWFRQELKPPREGVLFLEVKPGNTKTASLRSGDWVRHRDVQKCWSQRVICTMEPYAVLRNVKVTRAIPTFMILYTWRCFGLFWPNFPCHGSLMKKKCEKKNQETSKIEIIALPCTGLFK